MQLVECVPNFSEGQDQAVIDEIVDTIKSVEGVKLLDVDPGADMNRTVVTFVGSPDAVKEGAFQGIKKAAELIDMRKHSGSHPRMGATDVCPFVPVNNFTMEECVEIAKEVGERVGKELGVSVFLYEEAAQKPERKNLATIRKGEYEGMEEKIKQPKWKPDFGPTDLNKKAGCTAVGAREFLIAYNINLNTREAVYATDIAFELRKKGRTVREGNIDPFYFKGEIKRHTEDTFYCGSCDFEGESLDKVAEHTKKEHDYDLYWLLRQHDHNPEDLEGNAVKKPGMFDHVKSIGWFVKEYDCAQISINLTNYKITPPHAVYEAAKKLAEDRGLTVTGSEVVGLIPYQALIKSGKFYLERQGRSTGIPKQDILETAIQSLGLRDKTEFDLQEKVIGLPDDSDAELITMRTDEFVHEVSRESAAPGGGSVSALAGSLGAALASMVSNLSIGKRGTESVEKDLKSVADRAQELKDALLEAVDADTNAFNAFMEARRMPANTPEEKEARQQAMQDGLKEAIKVPYRTAELSFEAMKVAKTAAEKGNPNSVTDAGVGGLLGWAAVQGAVYNVKINMGDLRDKDFIDEYNEKCEFLLEAGKDLDEEIRQIVHRTMESK